MKDGKISSIINVNFYRKHKPYTASVKIWKINMNKNDNSIRGHIFVSGRVQGVAFRYYTQKMAQKLVITGWVRNCADGKVEIIAEGDKEKVNQLIVYKD